LVKKPGAKSSGKKFPNKNWLQATNKSLALHVKSFNAKQNKIGKKVSKKLCLGPLPEHKGDLH
jgi:hypothetical protein